jgi:hypothetical protein
MNVQAAASEGHHNDLLNMAPYPSGAPDARWPGLLTRFRNGNFLSRRAQSARSLLNGTGQRAPCAADEWQLRRLPRG